MSTIPIAVFYIFKITVPFSFSLGIIAKKLRAESDSYNVPIGIFATSPVPPKANDINFLHHERVGLTSKGKMSNTGYFHSMQVEQSTHLIKPV